MSLVVLHSPTSMIHTYIKTMKALLWYPLFTFNALLIRLKHEVKYEVLSDGECEVKHNVNYDIKLYLTVAYKITPFV